ncbi:MAG: RNA polymerase sigma factor [Thermoanaerobaculia bacterium]
MAHGQDPTLAAVLIRLSLRREDKEAWTLLYDLTWPRILAICYRALRGVHDRAEDASQEVFIRLLRYCDFRKVQDPGDFLRYLHTVAKNAANDYLREMRHVVVDFEQQEASLQDILPVATPEQVARAKELLERLWDELDPEERTLAEFLMEGHTVSEIAQRLGWSYSNAGVRIHRLRQRIRKLFKEKGLR